VITNPHKLFAAFERISGRYDRLEPLSAIPKKLRTAIEKKLFSFSDAYESEAWGAATLHQVGRVPEWTKAVMAAWNRAVAEAKTLINKAAVLPGVRGLTKEEQKKILEKQRPGPIVKIEKETVITGKYPWMFGLGAALIFLMAIQKRRRGQKKVFPPLPSRGLSGTRDQHAADAWHHLSRFSDHRADYLQALASRNCEKADKLRTASYAELEIAKAFRSWAPKPRQHNITDGITVRRMQMENSETHFRLTCMRIPVQTKLF